MIFPKILILTFLSLSTFVFSIPTPTINDEEGLAKRWYEDHKRYHPTGNLVARASASVSPVPGAQRKAKKPIPSSDPNSTGTGPLPLGAIEDLARCPATQMACPISPMTDVELARSDINTPYECVAPQEDLYSCGGCTTLGTGLDCTAIPGVLSVSCAIGACNVHSCQPGFTITSDGQGCVAVVSNNTTIPATNANATAPETSGNVTSTVTSPIEASPLASSTQL